MPYQKPAPCFSNRQRFSQTHRRLFGSGTVPWQGARNFTRVAQPVFDSICADATFFAPGRQISLTAILINYKMRAILVCIRIQMKQHTPPAPLQPATAPPASPRHRVDSEALLQGAATLEIDHAGQLYLLRVTRENKLILTK
jgi:hemin uptake protein HemP